MTITTTPLTPAAPSYRAIVQILLDLARAAHIALDDSEELASDHGRVHAIDGQAFDDMCEQLDLLDALPDDQPGVTLGPSGKAWWALRHVLGESADAPAQGCECANCANGMGDCQRGAPLSDDRIIEIANEVHRAMPADADDQAEMLAIVRECFAQAAPATQDPELLADMLRFLERINRETVFDARDLRYRIAQRLAAPIYPDDMAVDMLAAAMKAKLAKARKKGRGGWQDPEQCTADSLRQDLRRHVHKGDPVDVANSAMFLYARGERTIAPLDPDLVAAINAAPADAAAIMHNGHPVFITRTDLTMDQVTALADRVHELTATVVSIKHLAGEIVLQVVNDGEVPQHLESGQEVCVLYELQDQQEEA